MIKVSNDFESVSRRARRFQTILKAFRGVRGGFKRFWKRFAERAEVPNDFGSVSQSAWRFQTILEAFRGAHGGSKRFWKRFTIGAEV